MKEVILIITAYIMMIISGTQSLPNEAVSEIPAVVEKPAMSNSPYKLIVLKRRL